jgi:hypothetical protein
MAGFTWLSRLRSYRDLQSSADKACRANEEGAEFPISAFSEIPAGEGTSDSHSLLRSARREK